MIHYKIKRILVPIDFSTISFNALQHAEIIAKLTKARITLLNVIEPFVNTGGLDGGLTAAAMTVDQRSKVSNLRLLRRIASAMRKRRKIQTDAKSSIGRISTTITKIAKLIDADLIVMGTHGAKGFVQNVLGSKTYYVSTLSHKPLLAIHRRISSTGYHNLIYPIRDNAPAKKKLRQSLFFAKLFNPRVHVIGQMKSTDHRQAERVRRSCNIVKREFEKHGFKTKKVFTSAEHFAESVTRYASYYPGSLVVILQDFDFSIVEIFRKRFAKKIVHRVPSPVLVVPR